MKHTRVLIDGMNAAHRMRHAFAELHNDKGRPTGVLYGYMEMLSGIVQEFDPDEIVVVWDSPKGSWRQKVFPEYKSARRMRHEALSSEETTALEEFYRVQTADVEFALEAFGVPQLRVPFCEADDLIGLIANRSHANVQNVVVSTDRDYYQLVHRYRTVVCNPLTKRHIVQDEQGALIATDAPNDIIAPSPLVYLCRRTVEGDSSDSLPGIKGIGPKRAAALFPGPEQVGETAMTYIVRNLTVGYGSRRIVDAARASAGVAFRNLQLMQLGGLPPCGVPYVGRLGGGTAEVYRLIREAYAESARTAGRGRSRPLFLWYPPGNDPSPMLRFFRARNFGLALSPQGWKRVWETFDALDNRRYAAGVAIVEA